MDSPPQLEMASHPPPPPPPPPSPPPKHAAEQEDRSVSPGIIALPNFDTADCEIRPENNAESTSEAIAGSIGGVRAGMCFPPPPPPLPASIRAASLPAPPSPSQIHADPSLEICAAGVESKEPSIQLRDGRGGRTHPPPTRHAVAIHSPPPATGEDLPISRLALSISGGPARDQPRTFDMAGREERLVGGGEGYRRWDGGKASGRAAASPRPAFVGISSGGNRRSESLLRAASAARAAAAALSLIAFSVMAADKTPGWSGDSFDRHKEYRYFVAVNVLVFAYAAFHVLSFFHRTISSRVVAGRSMSYYSLVFIADQALAYLLMSASSSAAARSRDWVATWGSDEFNRRAAVAIAFSFLAFFAVAASSLVSSYELIAPFR